MPSSVRRFVLGLVLALGLALTSIAAQITWETGDDVMALGKDGQWYYAQVEETNGNLYHVNFLGLYKEWIDGSRIRPRTADEIQSVTTTSNAAESKPGDHRVEAALTELGLPTTTDKDGDFKLELPTSDGRTQLVWIISTTQTWGSLEIREVWSPGFHATGHITETLERRMLHDNNDKKLGAWRLMGTGDSEIAVFAVQVDANASSSALKDVIDLVKKVADDMEREVEGSDKL